MGYTIVSGNKSKSIYGNALIKCLNKSGVKVRTFSADGYGKRSLSSNRKKRIQVLKIVEKCADEILIDCALMYHFLANN